MSDPAYLIPLPVLILGWMLAGGSPGPATLSISGTAMEQGRKAGLLVAMGIVIGSAFWGVISGMGFSAIMMSHVWLFEIVRYAGATYLLYLAIRSLRSAMRKGQSKPSISTSSALFTKGLLLHLTNPKAILAWGSIYAIALPQNAETILVWKLFAALISSSVVVFLGYAILFSVKPIARAYAKTRRWFEFAFGLLFGAASLKILTLRLT